MSKAMKIDGWRYHNHAMIATGAPGSLANLNPLENGDIWHGGKSVLFARWVSNYDCGYPTEWWYCLKDNEYDIQSLNSKKRYRITRGRRCFDIKTINEQDYLDELANVQIRAFSEYPAEYRPDLSKERLKKQIQGWSRQKHVVFAAFKKGTTELCGFSLVNEFEKYCYFVQQKVKPECEKDEINAALVDGIVLYYDECIRNGYPLVDGQRNTMHETAFQEYLCKIFGFRKAYCRLNIKYRGWVGFAVKILYPARTQIGKCKGKLFHQIGSMLEMEQIRRSFE